MRRAAGFTLVEVVVALAIVTVGMAAVLAALSSSADTLSYLREKTFAQWVALNQIASVRLSGQQAATGTSNGTVEFAGRNWRWRRDVAKTEIPGVVRIDMKVRPAEGPGGDDSGWIAVVSGIQGDAVGAPNGYQPDWGSQTLPGRGVAGAATPTGLNAPVPAAAPLAPGTINSSGLPLDSGATGDPADGSGEPTTPVEPPPVPPSDTTTPQ